jgi:hypothetical protein
VEENQVFKSIQAGKQVSGKLFQISNRQNDKYNISFLFLWCWELNPGAQEFLRQVFYQGAPPTT